MNINISGINFKYKKLKFSKNGKGNHKKDGP